MDIEKEIESFEKWVTEDGKYPFCATRLDSSDNYRLTTTYLYWQAWRVRAEIEDSRNMQAGQKKG